MISSSSRSRRASSRLAASRPAGSPSTSAIASWDVFQWRFWLATLQSLPLNELFQQLRHEVQHQWRPGMGLWCVVGSGAIALLYWNGRLFLATGAGIGVMALVYVLHDWQPRLNTAALQKLLEGWNQPLMVAVGSGAIATLLTYLGVSVWAESESPWIAAGALLQSAGTLAVLLMLITNRLNRQTQRDRTVYSQLIADLAHADPLKRLIAVRQLTDWVSVLEDEPSDRRLGRSKKPTRQEIGDYFRVMLQREEDAIVREAVYDGLQTLDIILQLKQATAPLLQLTPRHPEAKPLGLLPLRPKRDRAAAPLLQSQPDDHF